MNSILMEMKICVSIMLQLFCRQEGEKRQRTEDKTGPPDQTSHSTLQTSKQADVEAQAGTSGSYPLQCNYNML